MFRSLLAHHQRVHICIKQSSIPSVIPSVWNCLKFFSVWILSWICTQYSWFQTFAVFWMLYVFFWVIPRRLNFICRRFGTLCLFPFYTSSRKGDNHLKYNSFDLPSLGPPWHEPYLVHKPARDLHVGHSTFTACFVNGPTPTPSHSFKLA
jgi:hypothetical protein